MTLTPLAFSAPSASSGDGALRARPLSCSSETRLCRSARSARTPSRISSSTLTAIRSSPQIGNVAPPMLAAAAATAIRCPREFASAIHLHYLLGGGGRQRFRGQSALRRGSAADDARWQAQRVAEAVNGADRAGA